MVTLNFKFVKTCKKEGLISAFANVRLRIKQHSLKLKKRIRRIAMEDEF